MTSKEDEHPMVVAYSALGSPGLGTFLGLMFGAAVGLLVTAAGWIVGGLYVITHPVDGAHLLIGVGLLLAGGIAMGFGYAYL